MDVDPVARLQALESEAWCTSQSRALYSTTTIPGFPWFTVRSEDANHADAPVRRHVIPHDFTFKVFVKGRWVGRDLVDVYAEEFSHHTRAYYEDCVRAGRLSCVRKKNQDGVATHGNQRRRELKRGVETLVTEREAVHSSSPSPTTVPTTANATAEKPAPLAQGDIVLHTVHRHEIPVAVGVSGVEAVRVVAVRIARYGLLCVEKPAGLPTHSSGRYQWNSVLAMLEYVLAPKRLARWLWGGDGLLQGLVDTSALSEAEKTELFQYYCSESCSQHKSAPERHEHTPSSCEDGTCESVNLNKAPRPCYRLDKVTSGVLLLGVHQQATKRVSQALMEKSLTMDAAVEHIMSDEATHAAPVVNALLSRPVALRKHYLARVKGTHFSLAPLSDHSRACWGQHHHRHTAVAAVDTRLAQGWLPSQPFPLEAWTAEAATLGGYPGALLITTPVPVQGVAALHATSGTRRADAAAGGGEGGGGEGGNSNHNGNSANEKTRCADVVCQSAVTLCQRIARYASTSQSLIHCVPLTGRLHQIRLHLISLGLPIVGDITTPSTKNITGGQGDEVARACGGGRGEDEEEKDASSSPSSPVVVVVWYDPLQLPSGYRAFLSAQHAPGTEAESALTVPLCYECARTLPLMTIHEDSANSSACLHAWEYELDAAMLCDNEAHAKLNGGHEEADELMEAGGTRRPQTHQYCFKRGNMIVFKAPVPQWAQPSDALPDALAV